MADHRLDGGMSPELAFDLGCAGLAILKHMHDLSDEVLCDRCWAENPYFQYFCGEEFFQHRLVLWEIGDVVDLLEAWERSNRLGRE